MDRKTVVKTTAFGVGCWYMGFRAGSNMMRNVVAQRIMKAAPQFARAVTKTLHDVHNRVVTVEDAAETLSCELKFIATTIDED